MKSPLLLLFLALTGLLGAQTNHAVAVSSNVFTPASLTVAPGDTVTWTNNGGFHNVNGSIADYPDNPTGFSNGPASSLAWTFSVVLDEVGTYDYQCDPHVGFGMVGQITVAAPAAPDTLLITEIMYNPPESGTDSLEFFEVYNPGSAAVDMTGWTVSAGVVFEFPAFSLAPGGFVVLAVNEAAFRNVFNYNGEVFEWASGGLGNGGETISLSDSSGTVVVTVEYDDRAPWPEGTDGEGASLVFCDLSAEINDGANWRAASAGTGIVIDGKDLLADPGVLSDCGLNNPALRWISSDLAVGEDQGTVTLRIEARNMQGAAFDALVTGGTTVSTEDFSTTPDLPATFTVADRPIDTLSIDVTLTDDEDEEGDELLRLSLRADAPTEITGSADLTITVTDNDQSVVAIASINALDDDGVAPANGQTVALQGVVHCLDFRDGDGLQFWIIEPNGDGINVFSFDDVDDYTVAEGDEVRIVGELTQFRGLLEIIPSAIELVSTGNDLVTPTPVDQLEETLESRYVTLTVDGATEEGIERAGGGYNISVIQRGNGDTTVVRVEDETGVDSTFLAEYFFGARIPESAMIITGLVSQRDFSAPFDDFYQLLPCGTDDFELTTSTRQPAWAQAVRIYPNPTAGALTLDLPAEVTYFRLIDLHGRVLRNGVPTARLDLSGLSSGLYQLQLSGAEGWTSRTVIKQ